MQKNSSKKAAKRIRKPTRYERAAEHVERFMRDPQTPQIIVDALASFMLDGENATDVEGIVHESAYTMHKEGGAAALARFLSIADRRGLRASMSGIFDPAQSVSAPAMNTFRQQAAELGKELDRRRANDPHALLAFRTLDNSLLARHGIAGGQVVLARPFASAPTEEEAESLLGRLVVARWTHEGRERLFARVFAGVHPTRGGLIFQYEPDDPQSSPLAPQFSGLDAEIVGPVIGAAHVSPVWTLRREGEQHHNHADAQPLTLACLSTHRGRYFGAIHS